MEEEDELSSEMISKRSNGNMCSLPKKSREKYEAQYKSFCSWRKEHGVLSSSETILLAYLREKAGCLRPTTLWSMYSMLRSMIGIEENINISQYSKVLNFLKRKSNGYVPKKSKVFTAEQVQKFVTEADDERYLATKVALIFGVCGTLNNDELTKIKLANIEHHGDELILVKIPITKTKYVRSFVINGEFAKIVTKYEALRPKKVETDRFFVNYRDGKCTVQVIGKNKFAVMPKQIAKFLNLPDCSSYTGRGIRRSAKIYSDNSPDLMDQPVKRHKNRQSSPVAEVSQNATLDPEATKRIIEIIMEQENDEPRIIALNNNVQTDESVSNESSNAENEIHDTEELMYSPSTIKMETFEESDDPESTQNDDFDTIWDQLNETHTRLRNKFSEYKEQKTFELNELKTIINKQKFEISNLKKQNKHLEYQLNLK